MSGFSLSSLLSTWSRRSAVAALLVLLVMAGAWAGTAAEKSKKEDTSKKSEAAAAQPVPKKPCEPPKPGTEAAKAGPVCTPDSQKFNTLEDIYGPTGENFQAALGFRVFEGNTTAGSALTSYGVGVDDMVVQWREFRLVQDNAACGTAGTESTGVGPGGACASAAMDSSVLYEGNALLGLTVVDSSPYNCTGGSPCTPHDCSATSGGNDCNNDSDNTDAGIDDCDCDNNGVRDVVAKVISFAEPQGEFVILNRVGSSDSYRGTLAISTGVNVPGVLFVTSLGSDAPVVTLRYTDSWDGSASGQICKNDPDPNKQGLVLGNAAINLIPGRVVVSAVRVQDTNGDQDGYPDTNETVDLFITVANKTGRPLTNLTAQLTTTDPKIDCILNSLILFGAVPPNGSAVSATAFRFKVASAADRSSATCNNPGPSGTCSNFVVVSGGCTASAQCQRTINDDYAASFTVTMAADQFDVTAATQTITLDVDRNATNPAINTSTFTEGFDGGFGNFQFMNLDVGKANNTLSNGLRCQYNDPDFINSFSYGTTECYLGFAAGQAPLNAWHSHSSTSPDGGRAYQGSRSMHYGTHTPGNAALDTYMLSQMDALVSKETVGSPGRPLISLAARVCQALQGGQVKSCNSAADCTSPASACGSSSPELSFKHQISVADDRHTNTPEGQTSDLGVVHVNVVGTSLWQKQTAFQNIYDEQATNAFSNCQFDPDDDGNNEDSYFDPTDPNRLYGPSSGCFPEFVFGFQGDTARPFGVANIGRASDGPGLPGALGLGTWVESKIDLTRYRGRSIRVRFVFSSGKISDTTTIEESFMWNPIPDDDGWYVDDVRVTQTLGTATPTVTLDTTNNSALSACGDACTTLVPSLTATPNPSPSPGLLVTISAQASTADRCVGGTLLYQFWNDLNNNGTLSAADGDSLLRDYTVNPIYEDAPLVSTNYGVIVKCSAGGTSASCNGATSTGFTEVTGAGNVAVNCPSPSLQLRFTSKTSMSALRIPGGAAYPAPPNSLDVVRGDLATLRSSDTFASSSPSCFLNGVSGALSDATNPSGGQGFYYVLRDNSHLRPTCDNNGSWTECYPSLGAGACGKEHSRGSAASTRDTQLGTLCN